jgi:hypothetical protein
MYHSSHAIYLTSESKGNASKASFRRRMLATIIWLPLALEKVEVSTETLFGLKQKWQRTLSKTQKRKRKFKCMKLTYHNIIPYNPIIVYFGTNRVR